MNKKRGKVFKNINGFTKKIFIVFIVFFMSFSALSTAGWSNNVVNAENQDNSTEYSSPWTSAGKNGVQSVSDSTNDSTPIEVVRVESGNETAIIKALTNDDEPKGYDEQVSSGLNPLGYEKGQVYMENVMSELLYIHNYDGASKTIVFDTYDVTTRQYQSQYYGRTAFANTKYIDDETFLGASVDYSKGNIRSNFETATKVDQNVNYSLIRDVSFDPFCTGRNNCFAFVALDLKDEVNANLVTWMYDYTNKVQSEVVTLGTLNWDGIDDDLYGHEMLNFMSITAGDYCGTGKDSTVVYFPGHGNGWSGDTGLVEVTWGKKDDGSLYYSASEVSEQLIHPLYTTGGGSTNWQKSAEPYDKLGCTLDTGDFNGDGIDDLVVLTNISWPDHKDNSNMQRYAPYLAISYGSKQLTGSIVKTKTSGEYVEAKRDSLDDGYTVWDMPRNPGLSVGDANGDGIDEIAVAGTKVTQYGANKSTSPSGSNRNNDPWYYYKQFDTMVVAIYSATNGGIQTQFFDPTMSATKWKEGGLYDDYIQPRSGVQFFAVNGTGRQEALFVDGNVYSFKAGSSVIDKSQTYTADYFTENDKAVDWRTVKNAYVQSVVAGNFDNNWAGREQLMVVLGYKSDSYHNDSAAIMTIGGMYDGDVVDEDSGKTTVYNNATGFYHSDLLNNATYLCVDEDSDVEDRYSCLVVALDCDDDGLQLEYQGVEYSYSDTQVQAVIQAAPSFEELGQANGSTTYSITGSYSKSSSHSWSNTHTIQAVISSNVYEFGGFGFDATAAFGDSFGWSHSWRKTQSTSFTAAFTATTENTVVLRRCPVYYYTYKVLNATDAQDGVEPEMTFMVGQAPIYIQISVEDYNSIVDEYNQIMAKKDTTGSDVKPVVLTTIDEDSLLSNEGNPWKYASNLGGKGIDNSDSYICDDEKGEGQFTGTPTWVRLGHSAGSSTVSLSKSSASESSWSQYDGFTMNITVKGGHKFFNAGISYGYTTQDTDSGSTSVSRDTGVSTTVSNISKSTLTKDNSAASETIDSYGFDWAFAAGKIKTGTQTTAEETIDVNVPLLHHIVSNITSPISPVTLLSVTEGKDDNGNKTLTLTWKLPEDDGSGRTYYTAEELQYRIYTRDESKKDEWARLTEEFVDVTINDDGTISYTYIPSTEEIVAGKMTSYAVRCSLKSQGDGAVESINSNAITYIFVSTGLSAYELAVQEGFEGTLEEWLESLKGADGKSAYEIAREKGYQGTEQEWLESLVGQPGAEGKSAYQLAKDNGFEGTVDEWLESLYGENGKSAYELAVQEGFEGTLAEWVKQLRGKTAYEIFLDSVLSDKLLTTEDFKALYTEETNSWYEVYLQALSKTDENITALTEEEFFKQCLNNGSYEAYLTWMSKFLKEYYPELSEEDLNNLYEKLSQITKSEFVQATTDCETVEEYAQKYVELLNESLKALSKDEESWVDIDWEKIKDDVIADCANIIGSIAGYNTYKTTVYDPEKNPNILTEEQWLDSLKGDEGKSAYQIAKDNGYQGSEKEWIESLNGSKGATGATGADGKDGKDGIDGKDGKDGKDGRGITSVEINEDGKLIITYSDGTTSDAGSVYANGGKRDPLVYVALALAGISLAGNVVLAYVLIDLKKGK